MSYPAIQAPSTTAFQSYVHKKSKIIPENEGAREDREQEDTNEQKMILVGETEDMEFVSNEEESERAANGGCRSVPQLTVDLIFQTNVLEGT